ncbi:hypothetical protein [Streptomyces sp. NBC_01435]|uniref:hypothetical protein n=1 Tax=Streptomyces sp. NBC_01435 TaxID=2903865 RepID=UPI002E3434BB|nr:hypothetical protein [Streptomyces sp. NBC_01435]
MNARANTPDQINADGSTAFHLKRACNGCGDLLGDLDDRDVDKCGNLADARAECPNCHPLVDLEAKGCRTWHLTRRDLGSIDDAIDQYGIYAKGYWEDIDGKLTVTGLRIGAGNDRVVAKFGDWIIRHPNGKWSTHPAPGTGAATP